MNAPKMHERVYFSGHVQGVGFRYQTRRIACEFEVAGYVRNLPDGRVEMEAVGEAGEVNAFIAAVGDRLSMYIRRTERQAMEVAGNFNGFVIR
ncbi:MAG: acylphosphatase [Opitutales bacterium]|nr:acylphosphatase [Opitutales bacterium]